MPTKKNDLVIIKKYSNRRLYDTSISQYVNLEDLRKMVINDENFKVLDATSGKDITNVVLAQIMLELENKGVTLLPVDFLRNLIKYYNNDFSATVSKYLDVAMDNFKNEHAKVSGGLANPFGLMEEITKQNMKFFTDTMKFFDPFSAKKEK